MSAHAGPYDVVMHVFSVKGWPLVNSSKLNDAGTVGWESGHGGSALAVGPEAPSKQNAPSAMSQRPQPVVRCGRHRPTSDWVDGMSVPSHSAEQRACTSACRSVATLRP